MKIFFFFSLVLWHLLLPAMFVRDLDLVKQQWTMIKQSLKSASFNPSEGPWHLLCHVNKRKWVFFCLALNSSSMHKTSLTPLSALMRSTDWHWAVGFLFFQPFPFSQMLLIGYSDLFFLRHIATSWFGVHLHGWMAAWKISFKIWGFSFIQPESCDKCFKEIPIHL